MRHACLRFGNWLVIIALIGAVGGHWLVLQSVAWTGMILENVRHSDVREALVETFDGDHPCALCKRITAGRQSQKKQEMQIVVTKLTLFLQSRTVVLAVPEPRAWQPVADTFSQMLAYQPPVPPPRQLQG